MAQQEHNIFLTENNSFFSSSDEDSIISMTPSNDDDEDSIISMIPSNDDEDSIISMTPSNDDDSKTRNENMLNIINELKLKYQNLLFQIDSLKERKDTWLQEKEIVDEEEYIDLLANKKNQISDNIDRLRSKEYLNEEENKEINNLENELNYLRDELFDAYDFFDFDNKEYELESEATMLSDQIREMEEKNEYDNISYSDGEWENMFENFSEEEENDDNVELIIRKNDLEEKNIELYNEYESVEEKIFTFLYANHIDEYTDLDVFIMDKTNELKVIEEKFETYKKTHIKNFNPNKQAKYEKEKHVLEKLIEETKQNKIDSIRLKEISKEIQETEESIREINEIIDDNWGNDDEDDWQRFESIENDVEMFGSGLETKKFFFPNRGSCKNHETPVLWSDTLDPNIFIISYGTEDDYLCYDIDELIGGFKPYGENDDIYSYRVFAEDGSIDSIPIEHGIQLIDLLEKNINDNSINENKEKLTQLLESLNKIKTKINFSSDEELIVIDYYSKISNESKEIIKSFFIQLFNVGMYMRRWKGPGNEFPLLSNDTKQENFNRSETVLPELEKLVNILDSLPEKHKIFIQMLKMVQHFDGISRQSTNSESSLERLIEKTVMGNFCIRQASTFFIGSGAYYSKILDNYSFEGYDINLLEQID